MKPKLGGKLLLRGALALASLAAILAFALWPRLSGAPYAQAVTAEPTPVATADLATSPSFGESLATLLSEIRAQEETDALILAELKLGAYSAEEPLILDNPYSFSPLTALVAFTTDSPANVQIRVHGKTSDADIVNDFPAPQTEHLIPIYGLYQDYLNTVTLSVTSASGQKIETTLQIQTEAIAPESIEGILIHTDISNAKAVSGGLNFLYTQLLAFDAYGEIRWVNNTWATESYAQYQYGDGTYITAYGAVLEGDVLLIERNFLGKFLRVWYSPYGVHHDIEEGANGNLLVTGSKGVAIEDFIYELDGETGEIVHTLDLKTILPRSSERINAAQRAQNILKEDWNMVAADWFHLNAIVWDDGDVILSGRHSSAVVKVAWPTGQIRWILASPYGWLPMYQKYLLTPLENQSEFEWQYWQHAPCLLPDQDNNPDTVDILLFDNGTIRFGEADVEEQLRTGEVAAMQNYSRMVQYRIDETDGTVLQVWQYGKERGEELFAYRCGDADLLPNGNRLGLFLIETNNLEHPSGHIVLSEVNAAGKLVWEALLTAENGLMMGYRAERMSPYRDSDQDLRIGQPARILIPDAVLAANAVQAP